MPPWASPFFTIFSNQPLKKVQRTYAILIQYLSIYLLIDKILLNN